MSLEINLKVLRAISAKSSISDLKIQCTCICMLNYGTVVPVLRYPSNERPPPPSIKYKLANLAAFEMFSVQSLQKMEIAIFITTCKPVFVKL